MKFAYVKFITDQIKIILGRKNTFAQTLNIFC